MIKNVGLYFGSFSPIHVGHLVVANTVLDKLNLDEIWFVITPMSPDKVDVDMLDHMSRLDILRNSISDNPRLQVSTIEIGMEQPNYTYKTLRKLREINPEIEFSVIMGTDNSNNLKNWLNVGEIGVNHRLILVNRDNYEPKSENFDWYGDYVRVEIPRLDVSSTLIRSKINKNESIRYLVPRSSEGLIIEYYGNKQKHKET